MKAPLTALLTLTGVSAACGVVDAPTHAAVEQAAAREGLPRELLSALVWTESAFCPTALSPAGAIGYGQLMPGTARELGVNPFDPQENLRGAARYLRAQWNTFGSWPLALAAYNAGPGAVLKYGGVPPYPETQRYVVKVLGTYSQLLNTFTPTPAAPRVAAAPRPKPPLAAAPGTPTRAAVTPSPTPVRAATTAPTAAPQGAPATPAPSPAPPLALTVVRPTSSPTNGAADGLTVVRPPTPEGAFLSAALPPQSP